MDSHYRLPDVGECDVEYRERFGELDRAAHAYDHRVTEEVLQWSCEMADQ